MPNIEVGWLKNKKGEKFAPKTLASQVLTKDGLSIEYLINESGANVSTPDWNQNNENSSDYIKNRTHYKTASKELVLEETNDYFYEEMETVMGSGNVAEERIKSNETYIVTVDGIEYKCNSYQLTGSDGELYNAIGDSRLYEGNTTNSENMPFLVYYRLILEDSGYSSKRYNHWYGFENSDNSTHNIQIEVESGVEYHQLDEGFIPNTIARTEYVDSTFARKEDVQDVDLSNYEKKQNAQLKYDEFSEGIASKQDVLTGTEGQVVQIGSDGKASASDLDLISVEDIDAICGGAIQYAEEVMF